MLTELWRITSFRLTLLYGGLFALAVVALLGLVYVQAATYQNAQVDQILVNEIHAFVAAPRATLPDDIAHEMRRDFRHINHYGLFDANGQRLAGNMAYVPYSLVLNGRPAAVSPRDDPQLTAGDRELRAVGQSIGNGETLIVARDVALLRQLRVALLRSCLVFGIVVLIAGALGGVWFSLPAVRQIRAINSVTREIAAGDYRRRLPLARRNPELDRLAQIVNAMLDDTERLMGEVKSCSDNIAHDLRTPLTRLRAAIYRAQQTAGAGAPVAGLLDNALAQTDILLGRFRALSRISEIEAKRRVAGFAAVDPAPILRQIASLYEPLASQRGIRFTLALEADCRIHADGELLFEALGNLVDNALKFTPPGGEVTVSLTLQPRGAVIAVADTGPGIPEDRRRSVLQRFYRLAEAKNVEGSGLGLSLVDAIVRLHGFQLVLDDTPGGGTSARLCCWNAALEADSAPAQRNAD